MHFNKHSFLIAVLAIFLSAVAWKNFLPIQFGVMTLSDAKKNSAENVNISRPRYFPPREIRSYGWPLPGGDFGFFTDPHFLTTNATSIQMDAGQTATVQGINVNYAFTKPNLVENVLALEVGQEIFEFDLADVNFSSVLGDMLAIASSSELVHIFVPIYYSSEMGSHSLLLRVSFVENDGGISVVSSTSEAEWKAEIEAIRKAGILDIEKLCAARLLPGSDLYKVLSGHSCGR